MRLRTAVRSWLTGAGLDAAFDAAWYIALGWIAVNNDSGIPAWVLLVAASAPRALMFLGGLVADLWGVLQTTQTTMSVRIGLAIIFGAAFTFAGNGAVGWWFVLLALVFGIVDAIHMPAMGSIGPHLVSAEGELRQMNARLATVTTGADALIAPLAGVVVVAAPAFIGWGGAVMMAAAYLCFMRLDRAAPSLRQPEPFEGGIRAGLQQGLSRFRDNSFAWILAAYFVSNIATTAPLYLGIPFQAREHNWGGLVYGAVALCYTLGFAAGAERRRLLEKRGETTNSPVAKAMSLLVLATAGVVGMTLATNPIVLGVAAFLTALVVAPSGVYMKSFIQARTPKSELARVGGIINLAIWSAIPLGHLTYGLWTAAAGGDVRPAGLALAAVMLAVSAGGWVATRRR